MRKATRARADAPKVPAIRAGYIHVLAFFSGMCIMATELSASRLLAPFFGTTTFVWTNIIGCIMIALAAGYVSGGRLADRRPDIRVLLKLQAGASIFLVLVPFVSPMLVGAIVDPLRSVHSSFSFIFYGSLAAITVLFVPPIFVLGMTSPFLIRLVASERNVGDAAGRIFGISTIGSIAGTFLPILLFIPNLGTGKTIIFFAVLLLLVSVIGLASPRYTGTAIAAAALLAVPIPAVHGRQDRLYTTESEYQYIEVTDNGAYRFLAYNDAAGFQTVARKGAWLTGFYFDFYSLVPLLPQQQVHRILLVGLGGGTIVNQLHHYYPAAEIDAVEIDPEVISIAHDYFDLTESVHVFNQDGRVFVSGCRSSYDVVIVDAYSQQVYIPFHLATAEFFREVKRILSPGGILAMNVASSGDDSLLLRSVLNTLARELRHVARFRIGNSPSTVVLASDSPIDARRLEVAAGTELQDLAVHAEGRWSEVGFDPGLDCLTDDRAPIEHMVDWELLGVSR